MITDKIVNLGKYSGTKAWHTIASNIIEIDKYLGYTCFSE